MKVVVAILSFLALIVAVGTSVHQIDLENFHSRSLKVAEFSYSSGCFFEARYSCVNVRDEIDRGNCYMQAVKGCPEFGERFRQGMEEMGRGY